MYLQYLKIDHFKNHLEIELFFKSPIVLFLGENGVGKTNILDALHYLCMAKSYFNHTSDAESVHYDSNFFRIEGRFCSDSLGFVEKIVCSTEKM